MAYTPTEQEGLEASISARELTLETLQDKGPSIPSIVLKLKQSLNAKETKTSFDKLSGQWKYSKPLVAHRIRLDAAKVLLDLYGAMPSQKVDVEHKGSIQINVTRKIVDGGAQE